MLGQLFKFLGGIGSPKEDKAFFRRRQRPDFLDSLLKNLVHSDDTRSESVQEKFMISLTKLDGTAILINPDLITTVESTPDTVVALLNGVRLMIQESPEELTERVVEFRRSTYGRLPVVVESASRDDADEI